MRIAEILARSEVLLLDGGLATRLETLGHALHPQLWSAGVLQTAPGAISRVHRDYLNSGARCIVTASYQASIEGFTAAGFAPDRARGLLKRSVSLALSARDQFIETCGKNDDQFEPLVAASIGPYGAYLADGSEYSGDYGVSRARLRDFHASRMDLLLEAGPDLLAIETMPSALEVEVLLELLEEHPGVEAWLSLSCRDGTSLCDGTLLDDVARMAAVSPAVAAIGANCVAPRLTAAIVACLQRATSKPLVVYPNSGERYDALHRCWHGARNPADFAELALNWRAAGVKLIGGCCRTEPAHIRAMAQALFAPD